MTIEFVPQRVPVVDLATGMMTREWYLLMQRLFRMSSGIANEDIALVYPASDNSAAAAAYGLLTSGYDLVPAQAPPPRLADDFTPPLAPMTLQDDLSPPVVPATLSGLGGAAAGANSDITSLSGLTTPLSVSQGGTGDAGTAWTTYTPTVTAATGAFTTVSATGAFKRIGKTAFIEVDILITTNGTAATSVLVSLPFTLARRFVLVGRENAITGNALLMPGSAGDSTLPIVRLDATYPGGNGYRLVVNGVVETT